MRQLANDGFPVVIDVDTDDFVTRHHDVVHAHLFQIQHRQEHVLITSGDLRAGFVHDGAKLLFAERAADGDVGFDSHHPHQDARHHVQQPDQRHHQDLQRCQQEAARIGDLFRVKRGDGFWQHFGKHQHHECQHAGGNCDPGVAVQAHPDDGAERRGQNIDEVVADEHQANQAIRLAEQFFNATGGAVTLFSTMT